MAFPHIVQREPRVGSCACGCSTALSLQALTNVRVEAAQEHEAATEDEEAEVDIVPAFVADSKSAELVLPGLGSFHDPGVETESLLGFNAWTGNA